MLHVGESFSRCFSDDEYGWLQERFGSLEGFYEALAETARYWLTTSPNYPILASLDCATLQMAAEGFALIDKLVRFSTELNGVAEKLGARVRLADLVGNRPGYEGYKLDPLKVMVAVQPGSTDSGASHFALALRGLSQAYGQTAPVIPEKKVWSSGRRAGGHLLFVIRAGTDSDHVDALGQRLRSIGDHIGWASHEPYATTRLEPLQPSVVPRDAHFATDIETLASSRLLGVWPVRWWFHIRRASH